MFKKSYSLEQRKSESTKIMNKYPDRIPVVVQQIENSSLNKIDKNKYLVPRDLTVGQFMYVIRKRIKLGKEQALILYVNNTLPPSTMLMSVLYKEYKDKDKFLYVFYSGENCFG